MEAALEWYTEKMKTINSKKQGQRRYVALGVYLAGIK